MSKPGDQLEIFKLLGEFCSVGHLKNLVKAYRPTVKEFPLSVSGDELLRSVEKLFSANHIPLKAIEDLLERAEENGRQHVFLYTPASETARKRLTDFKLVQRVLLDGQTRTAAGLPRFQIHPTGVAVADLRYEQREGTKYHFWVYKLYGGSERWIQTSSKITGDEKVVRYKLDYRREVFVIKWHSFGLLELRVPTGNSRAQLAEYRDALLRDVARIITKGDSTEEDATEVLAKAITVRRPPKSVNDSESTNGKGVKALAMPLSKLDSDARSPDVRWIHVNDSLLDYHGTKLRIHADDENENAYSHPEVRKLFKDVHDCKEVRAILHLADQPDSPQKISAEFSTSFANEIRIGPQTTPEAVEFIIRRVWERASPEALPQSPVDDFGRAVDEGPKLRLVELESTIQRYPYLVNAFKGLQDWIEKNPTVEFIETDRLRKQATAGVPPEDFAVALAALVEDGVLVRKFRVRPSVGRRFVPEVFDSFEKISSGQIKDSKGDVINLDDAQIVAVFGRSTS